MWAFSEPGVLYMDAIYLGNLVLSMNGAIDSRHGGLGKSGSHGISGAPPTVALARNAICL